MKVRDEGEVEKGTKGRAEEEVERGTKEKDGEGGAIELEMREKERLGKGTKERWGRWRRRRRGELPVYGQCAGNINLLSPLELEV